MQNHFNNSDDGKRLTDGDKGYASYHRKGIPNIIEELSHLVAQIPPGRVSTYSTLAKALGDRRVAVAVYMMLRDTPNIDGAHRVIGADGHIGINPENAIIMLRREGVNVMGNQVRFPTNILFTAFKGRKPLVRLRQRQRMLAERIILSDCKNIQNIAAIDIAYSGNQAFGIAVVCDLKSGIVTDVIHTKARLDFSYMPTYLFYREFPVIKLLANQLDEKSVLILDGNGILHPLGIGVATQAGVELGRRTMGVAKSLLCGIVKWIPASIGSYSGIDLDGKIVGYCLKISAGKRFVYISAGHRMTSKNALYIYKSAVNKFKIHPMRMAHNEARKLVCESTGSVVT